MDWPEGPLILGNFVERLHRFGAMVKVAGRKEYCHVTNSGRLRELLVPGARVALVDHGPKLTQFLKNKWGLRPQQGKLRDPHYLHWAPPILTRKNEGKTLRKTRYAIRLAFYRGHWVCIEANIAPKLLKEAWQAERIPDIRKYDKLQAEVPLDAGTRFDFLAENSRTGEKAWIEVKCVTLVDKKGAGWFPDAPSERASKHLRELMALSRKPKTKCFVFFVLQNPLGKSVSPKEDTDPLFGKTLWETARSKVQLRALRASVGLRSARIEDPVPILL